MVLGSGVRHCGRWMRLEWERIGRICLTPSGEYLVVANAEGEDGGEDEAGSAEGDDVHSMDLREELHGTADDDGDENLGKNDEKIKDSHVDPHLG